MIEIWKSLELLDEKKFASIQEIVDTFITPLDIGPIPLKIASKFSGFTADKWKNWFFFYSLPTLKCILPTDHYTCWAKFVQICWLLCRITINASDVKEADDMIMEFCWSFVNLYGKSLLTPNMHLRGHLASVIQDYGPVYSFWLFPYERLNGILGSYHTNSQNISVQLMTRFWDHDLYSTYKWPQDMIDTFYPVISKCKCSVGSLKQSTLETELSSDFIITPIPPIYEDAFLKEEHQLA